MIIPDSQFDAAAQSVAQPDTDPMDRAASQVAGDQKVRLRASLYSSLMANPDMAARAQRLGRKTGLPGDVVERNLPEVERSAALNDIDRALERSPALAQWLADPKNARVAHDDVPQMGAIEAAVKWLVSAPGSPSTLGGTLRSAYHGASAGSAGAFQAVAGTAAPLLDFLEPVQGIGGNPLRRLQEGFGLIAQDALASQKAARGKSATWLGSAVDSGVESLAQNAGFLPLALLPGGQAAALTGMSAMAGGQTYTRDIQKGQGHWPALMHGASDAAIEAGTEMLPMARLIGDIKAGTPLFQTLLKNAALEVPGEQAATALQDLNDWAVNNNGRTFSDYLKERPEAAAQTLIATLVGVGGNVAIMKGVQGVADRAAGVERRAQMAEQHGQALADVSKLIEASKLRQRDPEAFATFAQSLTEEGVSSLYVDARALQQSGVDLQALAQAMPSVAQQIDQAAATGGDVVIPTGEFLTQAPGQEWSAALIDHARTAADAMSPAGAREYMQAHGEQLQDEIAKTIEQHATDQEWQAGRDAVRSSFEAQLNEVGRFTPDVNRQYAALLGDYYAATAARAGMTPQELADRYPLRVQAKAAPGAVNAMEQAGPVVYRGRTGTGPLRMRGGVAYFTDNRAAAESFPRQRIEEEGADGSVNVMEARLNLRNPASEADIERIAEQEGIDLLHPDYPVAYLDGSPDLVAALKAAGYDGAVGTDGRPDNGREIKSYAVFDSSTVEAVLNQSARLPATIDIDGQQRSTTNSKGQQIAATEEGVRAFYRWFKDSSVVDADGQPLVVYHGSDVEFEQFAKVNDNTGAGFWFAENDGFASDFGDVVRNFYVSIRTPLDISEATGLRPLGNWREIFESLGVDGIKFDSALSDQRGVTYAFNELMPSKAGQLEGDGNLIEAIRSAGFDGVRAPDEAATSGYETGGVWIAFRPEQIKSVNNSGAFDPADPSILNQSVLSGDIDIETARSIVEDEDSDEIPDGWFVHGRSGGSELNGSWPIQMTRDAHVAVSYAGSRGSVWAIKANDKTKVADFTSDDSDDMDSFIESLRDEFDIQKDESGTPIAAVVDAIEGSTGLDRDEIDFDTFEEVVRDEFTPIKIVDTARAFDSDVFLALLEYYPGGWPDMVTTPDGAVVMPEAYTNVDRVNLSDVAAGDPANPSILNQSARAQIAFGPDITQTPSVISLFNGADLSSFIHEAGHFFLEAHMDLAGRIAGRIADGEQVSDGERGIVADANALLGWFGVTGVEQAGGAGGGALEQDAAWAEPTGKRSPITRKPVFELFDADGKSLGFTHSYVTAEDAIAGRNRPVSGPPAAPTYTLPEPELPPRSNWKQVKGQQFSNLDEDDGFLYHITAADRAAGIRENGLAPNSGGMFGGAYANYSAGKVFLTERSGVSYWQERVELQLQAASDNPPSVVVMRIPKDKITAQLTPDDIGTKDARARAYYSTATLFQTSQQGADQPDARPEPPAIGRTPLETWAMMSIDQQRAFHEQFARGFELYALEGKAPSLSLQSVFQRFSAWLKSVYRSITKRSAEDVLQVHLTDEVRQVMDRMIATDEQIAEAQAMREMGPLFGGADQAGMTPEQWAQYHELAAQATSQASEQLQARGLRDMQWMRNAHSRELKRLQARAAGLRSEVEMEVRREVLSMPLYRAWQFLTTKGDAQATAQPTPRVRASGALDPASDNLFTAIAKLGGLDRSEVVGAWGVDPKDRLESGVFGAPVLRKENGLSIDAMAEKLAEEGYLLRDESGRTDPADLEAAFDSQRRGVDQYSTWHDLTEDARVRAATGADAPEALPDEIMHGKLDTAVLRDMYGTKPDALWRTLSTRRMTSEASGIHPEVVAETFGYDSADALVRALAAADPPRQVIEGLTDQRMLERYGDLATPEGLQRAADEAIHNEARARAIATELDALEKMGKVRAGEPRTADVLAKAARDYALAVIGAKKVRDIRPGEYTAAEARASKAAQKAFKAGDTQAAATEKRHQLIQHAAAKAALQAREEIDKTLDYLRRMAKRPKSIAPDYADQIDQLLERFDLRPASLKELDKRAGLQAWVTAQQEQGKEVDIPPELLNEAARTSWRNLTLDELRGLRDTVKQIEHLGRTKGKLLASKAKREFEAVRDELADGIELHSRGRTADTRTPATVLGRRLAAIKRFGAAHIKVATWARIFDGGRDGGPAWEYLIRGANDAGDFETTRRAQATEALTKILSPVMKGLQRKAQYPSIGRSLTREQVLVMALNTGNEGNWQRMLDGEGWTRPQVMGVLNTLTAAEWQAVQGVWDHMESYRPEIGAKEKRVYGKEPEWVQSVPLLVDTSDGQRLTLRGGYFPIKYDPAANARAEGHADAEDAKRQMQGAYTSATTRRGFTKSRVQEVKGRPLMYSLSAVYGGVQDVIHDLAWHEWLIDTNKLLRSEKVDAAIRQHYGPEVVKQVKDWVKDIAAGDGPAQGAVDEAVSRLRRGVSVAGLGFNVMSAAMQPLGLTQSMVRVGAAWIGRGVAQYIANPRAAARRVNAASEFMASRARTRFRELNELRNQVEGQAGALTWVQQHSFWLMMRAQQTVDIPTWLGAYEKAISEGSDEARSVALADQAVIDAQGGGQLKDLAGIERGGPAQKLFTVFYSFFNTALNIGIGQGMTADTPAKRAKLAADALLLYSVPAVLGAILKDALQPGGDDDPEELAKKLAAAQLDYLMGLFVLVRETTEAVKIVTGLEDRPRDYAGPAGLRVIPDAFKFAKQAGQGEFDDAFRKASVNLIGSAFGLPAAQVNRTITGAQALAEDETDNPAALVFGFQKER